MCNHITCPTNDYKIGMPNGKCYSNGHYKCNNCIHLNPRFLNKQYLNDVLTGQGLYIVNSFKI